VLIEKVFDGHREILSNVVDEGPGSGGASLLFHKHSILERLPCQHLRDQYAPALNWWSRTVREPKAHTAQSLVHPRLGFGTLKSQRVRRSTSRQYPIQSFNCTPCIRPDLGRAQLKILADSSAIAQHRLDSIQDVRTSEISY